MSEQLKHKIQQWEATPPPGCWDAIASQLGDTPDYAAVAAKLYDTSITPPDGSWQAIATALEETNRPIAPVKKLHRPLQRAITVAAVLIVVAGAWWLFVQNRIAAPRQALKAGSAAGAVQPPASPALQNSTVANNHNDTEDAPGSLNGYRNPVRRPQAAGTRALKYTSVNLLPAYREYPITVAHHSLSASDESSMLRNMNVLLSDNNYLLITGPNGEATRASLKIADGLRYLYSDNNTDETNDKNNENSHWKKRLQEWRNKIISSHFIPATTNFLDIIDLKDLIEEKQ